jgi:vacuolar-type H+-ATPase subunit C/Vma6
MSGWSDLNARARGLATHLLDRPALENLARQPDLLAVGESLAHYGYPVEESGRGRGDDIELAARRVAASRLRVLRRWAGTRSPALTIIFEDEDRRSISSLLRGSVQHAAAEVRLSGLLPTPSLPERALEQLSRQPGPRAIAALLAAWKHPLAPALLPDAAQPEVDLMHLEVAISRAFLRRALETARAEGRRSILCRHVQRLIDLENAWSTLVLSGEKEPKLDDVWVEGGRELSRDTAQRAVRSGNMTAAGAIIAKAFGKTPVGRAFADRANYPLGLEPAVLAALIAEFKAKARLDPLSPAVFLGYALRLRAELLDVRRVIWGISLGAPARFLLAGMGAPS